MQHNTTYIVCCTFSSVSLFAKFGKRGCDLVAKRKMPKELQAAAGGEIIGV
jgi:hypothetical protein